MSPIGKDEARRAAGFTLIEIVCVLAILALVAAIVWPSWPVGTTRPKLARLGVDMAALLKAERADAIKGQAEARAIIGDREMRSSHGARRVEIPADVALRYSSEGPCRASSAVIFDSLGRSCGHLLRLEAPHDRLDLVINAVTGGIEIVAAP